MPQHMELGTGVGVAPRGVHDGAGGRQWHLVYSTDTKGVFFDAIAFWDTRHGIAMSDPVDSAFFLITTDDGGRTWSRVPPQTLPRVQAVADARVRCPQRARCRIKPRCTVQPNAAIPRS